MTIDYHFEQTNLQNDAALFAGEWRRLWRDFARLPTYSQYLSGRVFPELANVRAGGAAGREDLLLLLLRRGGSCWARGGAGVRQQGTASGRRARAGCRAL